MIGILKYLTVILVSVFLPILLLIFCVNFKIYNYYPSLRQYDDILLTVIGYILILFILIYFIIPIIITIIAIKHHWSSYLDKFFNQLKLPTLVLLFGIPLLIFGYRYERTGSYDAISLYLGYFQLVLVSLIPPSCLIYLVILIHNIRKKYPNQCKKITDFMNTYRGMHNG